MSANLNCLHTTQSKTVKDGVLIIYCTDCGKELHAVKVYEKLGITRNTMPQLFEHICKRLSEEPKYATEVIGDYGESSGVKCPHCAGRVYPDSYAMKCPLCGLPFKVNEWVRLFKTEMAR